MIMLMIWMMINDGDAMDDNGDKMDDNGDHMDDDGDLAMGRSTVSTVHLLPLNLLSDPRIKFCSITIPNFSP